MQPQSLQRARIAQAYLIAAATLLAFHAQTVHAAILSWNSVLGGSAAIANNWSPTQLPLSTDDLLFNLSGVFTVTFNNSVTSSRTHNYRKGTVALNITSPHTVSTGMTIGDVNLDNATVNLTTGTLNSSASVVVGNASGSFGTLNVNDDDAELIVAGAGADLTIGNNGDAALNITGLGYVQVADQFIVGSNATSSPAVTVSGALATPPFGLSHLDVLGTSQSRIGAGGDATMIVSNGALAEFAGDLVIANGSASVSSVTVETAGLFNARLLIADDLLIGRNTSAGAAAGNATLEINTGGTTSVGGDTLLGDPDGGVGTIVLGGGTFESALPVTMETGSAITGFGTVNANVTVGSGNIVTTSTGITMNGIINNTAAGVFGTKMHFGSTGGYTGTGSCAVEITGDASALITATGSLSLGKNTTAGVSYNGQLAVGSQNVTLLDSNGAVLGGLTTMGSTGSLACANGIGLANGGRIRGEGTLVGNSIISGVLDPQRTGTPGGIMAIQGNLIINPSGVYDMEIGGPPASASHDRCNVSGTAAFGGTIRLSLPAAYVPRVGEQFIAINATLGRTGEFVSIIPPNPAPCNDVTFVMVYSSTAAIVLVRPPLGCTALGDLNSDGGCDGLDIQFFVDIAVSGIYDGCADMNADCSVDAGDIPNFLNCLL